MPDLPELLNQQNKLQKQLVEGLYDKKNVEAIQAKLKKVESRIAALK
jgi:hypothetical protein